MSIFKNTVRVLLFSITLFLQSLAASSQGIAIAKNSYNQGKVVYTDMLFFIDDSYQNVLFSTTSTSTVFRNMVTYAANSVNPTSRALILVPNNTVTRDGNAAKTLLESLGYTVVISSTPASFNTVSSLQQFDIVINGHSTGSNTVFNDASFCTSLDGYVAGGGGLILNGLGSWAAGQGANYKNVLQAISPFSTIPGYGILTSYNLTYVAPNDPILANVPAVSIPTTNYATPLNSGYVLRSGATIVATFAAYEPYSASSNSPVCSGSNISLTASGGTAYSWTGPNGFTSSSQNPTITNATTANTGTYSCVITLSGGGTTTLTVSVVVNNAPVITTQPSNASASTATNASFSVVSSGTNLTYQWQVNSSSGFTNISNAAPYSGATTSTLTVSSPALSLNGYTYRCIVSNSGCTSATTNAATLNVSTCAVTSAGTLSGTQTICAPGTTTFTSTASPVQLDRGLSFIGSTTEQTSDYVNVNSSFPVSSGDFTIEVWVKPTIIDNSYRGFFGSQAQLTQTTSNRDQSMWVGPNGSLHTDYFTGGVRYDMLTSNNFFSADTWTHVAWVKEGTTFKLYKNGVFVTSRTAPANAPAVNGFYWLGRVDNFFTGSLDEFRIWNVARSENQIQLNMNKEVAAQTNLVAYYNFNQGTASGTNTGLTNLTDGSGNSLNGTLTGFTLSGSTSNWVDGATVGGTWTSSDASIATVNPLTGVIAGVNAGTATITYTLEATGSCTDPTATRTVTVSGYTSTYNFNTANQLTNHFNSGGGAANITQTTNTGLGGTGAVNITNGGTDIFTSKAGYPNGGVGTIYIFSAFFKNAGTNGYGSLGITTSTAAAHSQTAAPAVGIGVSVHGGAFNYTNNQTSTSVLWTQNGLINWTGGSDFINTTTSPDAWYKVVLKVKVLANSQYEMTVEVYPANADGSIMSAYTTNPATRHVVTVTNTDLASATSIYPYFGFAGARFSDFDNYTKSMATAGVLSGTQAVCAQSTSQFATNGDIGGTWSSSNTSVATVSSTGLVTGVAAGSATISYTITGTGGCADISASRSVTVTAPVSAPAITGTPQRICIGSTTQYEALGTTGALAFDGTNDVVSGSNASALDIRADITVEGWFKVNQYPSDWTMLVGKGDGWYNRTYGLWLQNNGTLLWQMYGSGGNSQVSTTTALALGTWYHVAATRTGTSMKVYINGVEAASTTYTATPNSTTEPLRLGYGSVHAYYNGVMDEVRVWNVGRTAAQIQANKDKEITAQTGLVAYYKFNQGTADGTNTGLTTALDASGNGFDGALSGFALTGTTSNWTSRPSQPAGTWSSSNTAIASVDQNGLVTGVGEGTATITFTATGQGGCADASSTRTVTVNPAIVVNQVASQYINNGGTTSPVTFTSSTSGVTFNWTNSNTAIIPVSQASGNIASFAVSNTGTAPVSTTISVTGTATQNNLTCTGAPMTFQIVVNPVAVMNQATSQEVCPGASTTAVNFTSPNTGGTVTYAWSNNNTSIGLAASGTGNIPAFTATNTTSDYQTATITVTPTYTNGGTSNTGASTTFTITVKPNSSVTQVANLTYCNGATGSVSFGSPVSGTTYAWTNSNTAIGLAASGTGNIANFQTTNTGTTAISGTITVTPTSNGCVGSPITFTITVSPTPVATTTTTSQVVCAGATIPAATFTTPVTGTVVNWTNSNPSIGLAASGTGNIPSFTATNTGNAPAVGTITVRPTLGTGTSGRLSYTVYSTHGGNGNTSQYGAHPNNAAEFDNMFNTANSLTTVHSSGEASASTLLGYYNTYDLINSGISVPNGGEFYGVKIVGTFIPTETGSYVFGVNGDDAVEAQIDGTVVASWYGGHGFGGLQQGQPINLVAGQPYTFMARIQEYGGGDGLVVAWKRPSQSDFSTQTDEIFGEACYGPSVTYTVTVNPIPTVATQSNQLVCAESTVTADFAGTVNGTTYSWTNTNTAIGLAASGTGSTLNFTATNAGPGQISGTITVTPSFTNGGVTCTGTPVTFTITVNPKGQVNAVNNQVLCNGSATTAVTFATTNNGLISSGGTQTASSGTISVSVPDGSTTGVTNAIPVTLPTGAVITNVRVTMNLTHSWISDMVINLKAPNGQILNLFEEHGGSGDNLVNTVVSSTGTTSFASGSAPFTGTFAATASIGVGPTGNVSTAANFAALYSTPNGNWTLALQDLYGGDLGTLTGWSISFDYAVQGAFGTNMNWTNTATSIGLAASGTGHIPSFTATNTGTAPVVSTVTVTPTYFNGGLSCPGTPITYTYTVNPTPTVNTVATQTFCAGTPATVTHAGTVPGTVYSWTNSNTAIGLAASGTGSLSFTPTNTGTTPITATITVTPSYTNAGVTCTGTPKTYTIMVNPVGQVNAVTSQVLCNGSATTAVTFATVNGGGTVTPGTPITASSGAITVAIPDNNAAGVAHTIPVTLPVSSVVTKVTANFNITHTWDSDLSINLVAPNGQVLNLVNRRGGSGDNFTNTTISPTATTAIASGSAPFTGTFLPDAAIGAGSTSFASTAANFAALYSVGSGDWKLVIRDHAGGDVGTLTGWSLTFEYGALIPAVTTYAWTNNTPSIGLAASGTGNIASFTATNTTAAPVTSTVTVTPTYTNNGVGCAGTPITYTYTVNPTPTVNVVANQTVCRGSNVAAITFSGATTGTVYTWTNSNTAVGLAASGTGDIASFVGTNTTAAPITATITVTPRYTNAGVTCVGTPRTFTITVNPIPTVNAVTSFPVCHNSPVSVPFSGATTGTVYSWTNTNPAIGLAASGTGNLSFTATNPNTGGAPITATITVTPSYTNNGVTCVGTPTSFTITVNPLPVVSAGTLPSRICISDTLVKLNGTPVGGSWSGIGTSGMNFIPTATNIGSYALTYTYADINGCVNRATITANVLACEERNRDLDNEAVILYPNPNSGQFNLRINSTRFNVLGMKVYNTAGQLVSVKQWGGLVYARVIPVNLTNLAAGIYVVRLYYGDGMDRGADKSYQIIIAR